MKKWFTYIKLSGLLLLFVSLFVNVYLWMQDVYTIKFRIALLITLIIILVTRTKLSWITGLVLFFYGLYDSIFISIYSAMPTAMQFTSVTAWFVSDEEKNKLIFRILYNLSDYFYLIFFILFLTKPVMKYYHLLTGKQKNDSYDRRPDVDPV
jgi:hypothetical protein